MTIEIQGECETRFEYVRDLLAEEFAAGRATGLAVAVAVAGVPVAHLWAGHADVGRAQPWSPQTIACLFSASKPLAAMCVLKLVECGRLELDAPVARYWPEFAARGKDTVTVRHALAHLAGVPVAEAAGVGAVFRRDELVSALAAQRPLWPAGTQLCFHSFTHGILSSELVRRVDGRSVSKFFREEIAQPFGLDLAFGLTPGELQRCADMQLMADNALFRMMTDPATPLGRSWQPMPWAALNSVEFRGADFPSIGGHGSALGLARFYSALASGGRLDGRSLLESRLVREALTEQAHEMDMFMGAPVRMGLALMLSNEQFPLTGRPTSFGQPGLGGVAGVGDTDGGIGVGVVVNRMSAGFQNPLLEGLLTGIARKSAQS